MALHGIEQQQLEDMTLAELFCLVDPGRVYRVLCHLGNVNGDLFTPRLFDSRGAVIKVINRVIKVVFLFIVLLLLLFCFCLLNFVFE